jgi:hypothetical protein
VNAEVEGGAAQVQKMSRVETLGGRVESHQASSEKYTEKGSWDSLRHLLI